MNPFLILIVDVDVIVDDEFVVSGTCENQLKPARVSREGRECAESHIDLDYSTLGSPKVRFVSLDEKCKAEDENYRLKCNWKELNLIGLRSRLLTNVSREILTKVEL